MLQLVNFATRWSLCLCALAGFVGAAEAQGPTSAAIGGRVVDDRGLGLQVFNLLNLLNAQWGRLQMPTGTVLATTSQIPLLSQVGQTAGPAAQPIYRFDSTLRRYDDQNFETYYQIQLAIRYDF